MSNHNAYHKPIYDKMTKNGTTEILNIDSKILFTFGPIGKWPNQKQFRTMYE
jgi:hypothetical protein